MTCIVAIKDNGKVYMGGDSAGVAGSKISYRRDEKVFINGPMLMGFTTSFRMGQILRYSLNVPYHSPEKSDMEYLCTDFAESIYKTFEDKGYGKIEMNQKKGGQFLVGYRGEIYVIHSDYQVALGNSVYEAIGSGAEVAMGSLFTTQFINMKIEDKLAYALQAASHHITSVKSPFNILSI